MHILLFTITSILIRKIRLFVHHLSIYLHGCPLVTAAIILKFWALEEPASLWSDWLRSCSSYTSLKPRSQVLAHRFNLFDLFILCSYDRMESACVWREKEEKTRQGKKSSWVANDKSRKVGKSLSTWPIVLIVGFWVRNLCFFLPYFLHPSFSLCFKIKNMVLKDGMSESTQK